MEEAEEEDKTNFHEWSENTIVSGIQCRECGETLPDHTASQHLDKDFMNTFYQCKCKRENKGKSSSPELDDDARTRVMEEVNQEVNDFYTAQDIQNQKDSQETMSDDDEEGTVKTKNDGAEETKEGFD